jgi:hypothetical protein
MPEGDTIHRAASRLAPALVGRTVLRFEAHRVPPPWPKPGVEVTGVEARGKHLLVHFDDGWTLQTHMRMSGSWHLYRPRERWRKPRHLLRALVEVGPALDGGEHEGWVAVCFSAPMVQLVREPRTLHLGPDLCTPDADLDEAVRRMDAAEPTTPLVDVLLDQRICCGVGNVYKSEVLFALGLHPLIPIGRSTPGGGAGWWRPPRDSCRPTSRRVPGPRLGGRRARWPSTAAGAIRAAGAAPRSPGPAPALTPGARTGARAANRSRRPRTDRLPVHRPVDSVDDRAFFDFGLCTVVRSAILSFLPRRRHRCSLS